MGEGIHDDDPMPNEDAMATLAACRDEMVEMATHVRAVTADDANVEQLFEKSVWLGWEVEVARVVAVLNETSWEVDYARAEALYTGYGKTSGLDDLTAAWHTVAGFADRFDEVMGNANHDCLLRARFDRMGDGAASNAQRLDRIERDLADLVEGAQRNRELLDEMLEFIARRFADEVESWLSEGGE